MPETLTSSQMRDVENAAIVSGRVTGLTLMERAGQGVIEALFTSRSDLAQGEHRAIVLCGPGNNGGDGFVIARLLAKLGWTVQVFLYADPSLLPSDARVNHDKWVGRAPGGAQRLSFPSVSQEEAAIFADAAFSEPPADIVVDALFGIGLNRPLTGLAPILAICHERRSQTYFVAVDVPSGLGEGGATGLGETSVFPADLTVTFHRRKQAHENGMSFCGRIMVQDIGL